jgi:UDP-3-O-[3-hydroxymyristoyl] glucosamine N-acyltransferase
MKRTLAYRLDDIAKRLGGTVHGSKDVIISQVSTLESAQSHQIAFLANSKYRSQLATTQAGAVILSAADADATSLPRIVCSNPYAAFAKVSTLLNPSPQPVAGIHSTAVVGEEVVIHQGVQIDANVVIGDGAQIGANSIIMAGCSIGEGVHIGENALLYPRVVVYHDCVLGNNLIAHSGVVIGADGFGLAMEEGRWLKIPQIGRVIIGDDVEIGANTTIDRGALDDTVIEDDVKLDNQIQIAHNVRIGAHTAIAGCVGIAGSTTIGRYCRIGGSAGILGHLQIADEVEVSSFTLVGKSIKERGSYCGIFPFTTTQTWRKNAAQVRHLDELADRVKLLEQQIEILKK